MSERERFEAWALSRKCPPELLSMGGDYGGNGLIAGQWAAWQAARSGQAASGSQENARSDEHVRRLQDAIEGECDGLAIDEHHARAILEYVLGGVGQPEAPTAAPLPKGWDVIRKDDLFKTIIVIAPNGYSAVTTAMSRNPENVLRMLVEDIAHPPARSGAGSEEAQPDRSEES